MSHRVKDGAPGFHIHIQHISSANRELRVLSTSITMKQSPQYACQNGTWYVKEGSICNSQQEEDKLVPSYFVQSVWVPQ